MPTQERLELIQKLEELRGSTVLAYVMSDRPPAGAQMGNDAVRIIYEHLRKFDKVEKLDLFIYSRGGDIDVPWRLATAFRNVAKQWNLLVPFRANSAATLLALGADEIVLGPQGELGPIDPKVPVQRHFAQPGGPPAIIQEDVGVEDVMAFLKFIRDRAELSEQNAVAAEVAKLAERIDPVALGQIYRTHLHIREVASRMLRSRREPPSDQSIAAVTEMLAERVYAHGHAVGITDAEEIGLPVTKATGELDSTLWSLLEAYEDDLKLLNPMDPFAAVAAADPHQEESKLAVIESVAALHEFQSTLEVRAQRQMPPNLTVNLNLNLQLPPGFDPTTLDEQAQQILQQLVQQSQANLADAANAAVMQAIKDQAPLAGNPEVRSLDGCWREVKR